MNTIAKGKITLSSANDAYSVLLSPNSGVIKTNWNGESPDYSNANFSIMLYQDNLPVSFEIKDIDTDFVGEIDVKQVNPTKATIKVINIDTKATSGLIRARIAAGKRYFAWIHIPITIIREAMMLDWILDWEGREKTEIAGEHIITPKIFVGKSENGGQLTGTYIGPSFDKSGRVGVFGYSQGKEIFHLDNTGGMIGGWVINDSGIHSKDSAMAILSNGSIQSSPDNQIAWSLGSDGSAMFAGGKVTMNADGSANFEGRIMASEGLIGSWKIGQHSLYNNAILIDSTESFIGVRKVNGHISKFEQTRDIFYTSLKQDGGIAIFNDGDVSYGIECWVPGINLQPTPSEGELVFSLGSSNMIAGWNFDKTAIYLGTKCNEAKTTTEKAGDITIGTNGLRGANWYIDTTGDINFVNGLLKFNQNGGNIAGWVLNAQQFSTGNTAIVSAPNYSGLYICNSNLQNSYIKYKEQITKEGGIYLCASTNGPTLYGSNNNGKMTFQLTSGVCYIGGWWFNNQAFFTGALPAASGFATAGNITLSPKGLRGHKFRLESDGSGALAGGNIEWDAEGIVKFAPGVYLSWDSETNEGTTITKEGIFTGKIKADNITAGTISTASITSKDKWLLDQDGSGYLAQRNIYWNQNGDLNINGNISVRTMTYALSAEKGMHGESNGDGSVIDDAFRIAALGGEYKYTLPHLQAGEYRSIKFLITQYTRSSGSVTFSVSDDNDVIFVGTRDTTIGGYKQVVGDGSPSSLLSLGLYDILGYYDDRQERTVWLIIKISSDNA